MSISSASLFTSLALLALPGTGLAQLQYPQGTPAQLTVEGFGNFTAGAQTGISSDGSHADAWRFDGAVRLLERLEIADLPGIGARVVAQRSPENGVQIREASLLLFGRSGRLEVGKRMGLPDVLTGYAPNSFTFVNAEFGPYSGLSLDPGGGLQTAFLPPDLRSWVEMLTSLGFTPLLAGDESPKVLYVSPRRNGFLAGVSFAPDATDPRFRQLVQAGLVNETYWEQNVLRWGGSYTFARGIPGGLDGPVHDLHSLNLGVEATLYDSLALGVSATYDGDSGLPNRNAAASRADAWGVATSINYNSGPWTWGAYYQVARADLDSAGGATRLRAYQTGASYRWNTHVRLYAAWFHYEIDQPVVSFTNRLPQGSVLLAGIRLAL